MTAPTKKEKYQKISDIKAATSIEELCQYYPKEFTKYFKYCRKLEFTDKPSISDLKHMFMHLMKKMNFELDYRFDWVVKKEKAE